NEHRVPLVPLPPDQCGPCLYTQPDPRSCLALRLLRRLQRARDLLQLPPTQGRPLRSAAGADRARRGVRPPNATKMTLSLRGRLLIGVISLVVIGLVVAIIATYVLLKNSLIGRVDYQLTNGVYEAASALGAGPTSRQQHPPFPVGTVVDLVGSDGSVVDGKVVSPNFANAPTARPNLPKTLPNYGTDKPAPPYDVSGTEGVQYRMTDWPEGRFGGQF